MNRYGEKKPRFPVAAAILIVSAAVLGVGIWHSASTARAIRPPVPTQPSIKQGPVAPPYNRQNRITDIDREVLKSIILKALGEQK